MFTTPLFTFTFKCTYEILCLTEALTQTSLLRFWRQSLSAKEARLSEQREPQHAGGQQVQDLSQKLQGAATELLAADMQRDALNHSEQHVRPVMCWHGKRCHSYAKTFL